MIYRQLYRDGVGNVWRTEKPPLDDSIIGEVERGPLAQYLRMQARNDLVWQKSVLGDIKLRMAWKYNGRTRKSTVSPKMKSRKGTRITGA